ncbi:MAG: tight adherence protein [Frankiaceae bacterium]|nr:tight adherence protein [Frankiaceae bacterium]
MSSPASGAILVLLAATGVGLAVRWSPPLRRPHLTDRLAPYLRDAPRASRLLDSSRTLTPFPTLERLLAPVLRDLARRVDRAVGGSGSVSRRLDQAGRPGTVEQFRIEQVVWGAGGLLLGLVLAVASIMRGAETSPVAFLVLACVLIAGGVLARDRALTREVARREQRMLSEFPTIAELLALSVAAGEGAVGALQRVTRLSSGELARELDRALADARAGASLVAALEGLAARSALPPLARFVDGMAIAVERGTPLAEVLRAQAVDVRELGRRALLEAAGRKEIAMLFPVVFLVLPVTVVFALFPGFYNLSLSVA